MVSNEAVHDAAEWAGQGSDLVVDYAGVDTTQRAVDAVKRGGMVVQVGLGLPTFTVATATMLGKTLVGTVQDIEEIFDLLLAREIDPYSPKTRSTRSVRAWNDCVVTRSPDAWSPASAGDRFSRAVRWPAI